MQIGRVRLIYWSFVPALLLLACTGPTIRSTAGQRFDFTYHYQAPRKTTGTIIIGTTGFPDTLNPLTATTTSAATLLPALWGDCLAHLPDLSLLTAGYRPNQCVEAPSVANGDESNDGLTTTLRLDPSARWSDGVPITAQDYAFFLAMATDPAFYGPVYYTEIAQVHIPDQYTLIITWKSAIPWYLNAVSGFQPLPLHVYQSAGVYDPATGNYDPDRAALLMNSDAFENTIPVTNGPYTVQSFKADDAVVLIKNPHYFSGFFHGPNADKIILQDYGTTTALIAAFQRGEIDTAQGFSLSDLSKLNTIPVNEHVFAPQIYIEHLEFNQRSVAPNAKLQGNVSIFTDPNMRQAFTLAFDRCQTLTTTIGLPCADPLIATSVMTGYPAIDFDPTVPAPPYDPTKAASLLDAAGYHVVAGKRMLADGHTPMVITVVSTEDPLRLAMLTLLKQQWEANLHITVHVERYSEGKLFTLYTNNGILATGQYDVSLYGYTFNSDPGEELEEGLRATQIPTAQNPDAQNEVGMQDAQVEALLNQGHTSRDLGERQRIYLALQRYLSSRYYFLPLYNVPQLSLRKTTLGNYLPSPFFDIATWNIADWFTSV